MPARLPPAFLWELARMATAAPSPVARADARLRADLSQAARRIRWADALKGALALAVLAFGYTAAAVLLDRTFDLAAEVRFAGLVLFGMAFLAVGYFAFVRPLGRQVNPRFAARQVEHAASDAKNAVINWVDLQDEKMAESVRASLAARAADEVAAADVRRVSESRGVTALAVAAGLLVATLAVLFVLFKPTPFLSLLNRAFNPFTQAGIATRTTLTLDAPAGGDVTILARDPLPVRVTVIGSLPDPAGSDRVRLLVRYNPDATELEEVPLEPAGSAREFALDLPPAVVQNGFWYSAAAGDARTPEYRVTVRPRPTITDYEAKYNYPAYTRLKPETARGSLIEAVRGTTVTLTVTANRPVKAGTLKLDTQATPVPGELVPDAPAALRFQFPLMESGGYRVAFTTAEGEPGDPTPPDLRVRATADAKPVVTISAPKEEEVTLPANGRLAVDALATDDYGVAGVTLKMQLAGPRPTPLAPRPYRAGKSLKRPADGSYPTRIEMKDSQPLADLKLADGKPASVGEGAVVEYWVEATDNCAVPVANVGKSKVRRVRVGPPVKEAEPQKQQEQKGQERQQAEQQHQKQQDRQHEGENRDPAQPQAGKPPPKEAPKDGKKENAQPGEGQGQSGGDPQPKPGTPETKPDATPPKTDSGAGQNTKSGQPPEAAPMPKPSGTDAGEQPPAPPPGQSQTPPADPDPKQKQGKEPQAKDHSPSSSKGGKESGTAPSEPQPDPMDEATRREAEKIQKEIDKQNQSKSPPDPKSNDPKQNKQPTDKDAQESTGAGQGQPQAGSPPGEPKVPEAKNPPDNAGPDAKGAGTGQPKPPADGAKTTGQKSQQGQSGGGAGDKPLDRQEIEQAARDLQQGTPDQKAAARGKLDRAMGKPNREAAEQQAEQIKKDLQSANPDVRKQAQQELNQAIEQAKKAGESQPNGGQSKGPPAGQKFDAKEIEQAAKNLNSKDPKVKADAERKLDDVMGKGNREADQKKADQLKDDLAAGGAKAEQARQELDASAKQMEKTSPQAKGGQPGATPPEAAPTPRAQPDPAKIEQAVKDMQSADPATKARGEKTLDDAIGKENRVAAQNKAEQLKKDLHSGDKSKRDAAQKELANLADHAKKAADQRAQSGPLPNPSPPGGGPKPDPKAVDEAVRNLNSPDPKTRQDAKDALDKTAGKDARQQAEANTARHKDDAKSGDPKTREQAEKGMADAVKQAQDAAAKRAQPGDGQKQPGDDDPDGQKPPSAEDIAKWKQKADDLNSTDAAKKKAAEEAFDKAVGKEAREQLQKDLADMKTGTPELQQAARDRLQNRAEKAADAAKKQDRRQAGPSQGSDAAGGKPLDADPRNRLKSAELQLKTFEDQKGNLDLKQRLGYTDEQYERFLASYRKAVEQQRAEVTRAEADAVKTPKGPAAIQVGGGSGGREVKGKADNGVGTGAGPGTAAAGFADAQRKFAEAAAKTPPPKK